MVHVALADAMRTMRDLVGARAAMAWGAPMLLLAISACDLGGSGDVSGGDTPEERAYLAGVDAALDLFDQRNEALGQALGQAYQTNEALFSALEGAGAGTAFEPGLEKLESLEPPPGYEDDHRQLIDRQRTLVLLDRDIGAAVADRDLVRFILLNMRLGLAGTHATLALSEPTCLVVAANTFEGHSTRPADELAEDMCEQGELPGDGYGERLRDILRTMTVDLADRAPALGFFELVPVAPDEDRQEVAREAFSEMVSATKRAMREIRDLDPPERMAGDHDRLLAYLDSAERVLDGMVDSILEGDLAALEGDEFSDLYCATRDEIGAAYRDIVRVHFADMFGICPGAGHF